MLRSSLSIRLSIKIFKTKNLNSTTEFQNIYISQKITIFIEAVLSISKITMYKASSTSKFTKSNKLIWVDWSSDSGLSGKFVVNIVNFFFNFIGSLSIDTEQKFLQIIITRAKLIKHKITISTFFHKLHKHQHWKY